MYYNKLQNILAHVVLFVYENVKTFYSYNQITFFMIKSKFLFLILKFFLSEKLPLVFISNVIKFWFFRSQTLPF